MVLGIDPGTRKCGFALCSALGEKPAAIGIVPRAHIIDRVRALAAEFPIDTVALGAGTSAGELGALLGAAGVPFTLVDERETTLRARSRYFDDNPPRGWRRFVPRGMLTPPRPIDDYAALLIAERYLATR